MLEQESYESVELPGVGEIRARKGTSTIELAGAAKYWYDKHKSAFVDGFAGGAVAVLLLELLAGGVYFLLRK